MKARPLRIIAGVAVCLVAGAAAFWFVHGLGEPASPLLRGGSQWSWEHGCTLTVPPGWTVQDKPIPSAVMMSSADNDRDRVRVQTMDELQFRFLMYSDADFASDKYLGTLRFEAEVAAAPDPSMHASNGKILFEGSGTFRSHPAAWSAIAFDLGQSGRYVNLVYTIGKVTEDRRVLSFVSFFLVPERQFDGLRPTFEAIAASCSARETK